MSHELESQYARNGESATEDAAVRTTSQTLPMVLTIMIVFLLGALVARDQHARRRESDIERRLNNVLAGYNEQRGMIRQTFTYAREVQRLNLELASLRGQLPTGLAPLDSSSRTVSSETTEQAPDVQADLPLYVPRPAFRQP